MERIAIYGGTFDPPHLGHVAAAEAVAALDTVRALHVIPAGHPYHKTRAVTPEPARHDLAQAAFSDIAKTTVITDPNTGPSYTIDVIGRYQHQQPGCLLAVVVGADAATDVPAWRNGSHLLETVSFIILTRPGTPLPDWTTDRQHTTVDVHASQSSTRIRELVAAQDATWRQHVPAAVAGIITARGLYQHDPARQRP